MLYPPPVSSPPLYRIALRLLAMPKKKYHKIRNDATTQRRFACHLQDAVAHSLHLHHHQHLLLQPPFPLLTLLLPQLHLSIRQAVRPTCVSCGLLYCRSPSSVSVLFSFRFRSFFVFIFIFCIAQASSTVRILALCKSFALPPTPRPLHSAHPTHAQRSA